MHNFLVFGDSGGLRTHDPWIKSPVLYPLSYGIIFYITLFTPQSHHQKSELVCPLRGEQNTSRLPGYKPGVTTNCTIEALGRGAGFEPAYEGFKVLCLTIFGDTPVHKIIWSG